MRLLSIMSHVRRSLALALILALGLPPFTPGPSPALAANTTTAVLTGGAGTVTVSNTLYARSGGALTLTVTTPSGTMCVEVTGAFSPPAATSPTGKTSWTFNFTAGAGNGMQTLTIQASSHAVKSNGGCDNDNGGASASFTLDNTGPLVTGALAPPPNALGWNMSDVTITWTATDAGSGVGTGPTPATDSVTANTPAGGVTRTSTATDRLGNSGTGSVTVKLDETPPIISGSQTPAANANGWNNTDVVVSFSCSDGLSGIATCPGPSTLTSSAAGQNASGTATDNAGNTASTTVSGINIDKVPPSIVGAPTTAPNGAGWYAGNVSIHWTCSDTLSGIDGQCPADSPLSTEGTSLTTSAAVSDKAGNSATGVSSPSVNIDKTPPLTVATAPSGWTNTSVTVSLAAADNLSGVASTFYTLDGGSQQAGTSIAITTEGIHTVQFWSADKAGNVEAPKTAQVKIDQTAPTISHTQAPPANGAGWNNTTVVVTFLCSDALSGVATCTSPQSVSGEGANQAVDGTATDNAGNTAGDLALVSIDKTAPSITGSRAPDPNANGWNNADVTVSFTCADQPGLSGLASCSTPTVLSANGAAQTVTGTATDGAGNSATATVSGIDIDKTPPAVSGNATPAPNANGWNNTDVVVHWTCEDPLSGLDGPCPSDSTISGEGANLSASASVADLAGNTASASVNGIRVDRTPPSIAGAATASPNPAGWYNSPVTVHFTCVDLLSTIDSCGPDTTITTEGTSNTAAGQAVDKAGNTASTSVSGIKIDLTPPSTSATPTGPISNGWYTSSVLVMFTATDALSGVDHISYTVDGGPPQVLSGGSLTFSQGGTHTIGYASTDIAGNTEVANTLVLQIDNIPPTITGNRDPQPNAFGWNNTDVKVSFSCSDAESGILDCHPDSSSPVVLAAEGTNQSVTGTAIDQAGNTATAQVPNVNIDKTPPTVTGGATTSPNAAGWYKGNVTVHWAVQDGLSGPDLSRLPADSTITVEGANQSVTSAAAYDKAGNSATGTVSKINIDKTAPTITADTVNPDQSHRSPNAAGWFNSAVAVHFTCADTLSGVSDCPADQVLNTDGTTNSATGTATDTAGNTASTTINGIKIDSKPPQTSADHQCDGSNGWCRGQTATVVLTAVDQTGLSGVSGIHYSINGNPWHFATGSSATVTVPLAAKSGLATVDFYAEDIAGNLETQSGVSLKYDNIAPSVTHSLNPAANAAGWNNSNLTVHFSAVDDDGGSGVDPTTVTPDQMISTETAGQLVNGQAYDLAGNKGTDSVTVKLDKTVPTISGAATTAPNANGWYKGPVTVHFACADPVSNSVSSGLPTDACPDQTITTSGSGQSVGATVTDLAGNTASTTVSGINIDATVPTLAVTGVQNGGIYTLGAVPAPSCTASDALSGLAGPCSGSQAGGTPNGVGSFTYSATVTDKAGNTTTATVSYRVIYRFDGFLQPINDTAHQVGTMTSIFKGGSTVPAKFQLMKSDGSIVQANALPAWLSPAKGGATSAPDNEAVFSDPATSGTSYRWDSSGQQYIYNWGTSKPQTGYYWRIGVALDDGQTYLVDIGLR